MTRLGRSVLCALLSALVLLTGLALTPATAGAAPAGLEPGDLEPRLERALADLGADDEVLVLVGAVSAAKARQAITEAGGTPYRSFEKVGFSSAMLTRSQVLDVVATPGVDYVQGNWAQRPVSDTATTATRVQQGEQLFEEAEGTALDGSGVGIAIVDSGMAGDHVMFRDAADTGTRLLNIKQACVVVTACSTHGNVEESFFIDATGTDTDLLATGGHGTHVAAIAGGAEVVTSLGDEARGVATESSLYGLGAGAALFVLNASASVNWVLEHHADPCGAFPSAPAVVGGCAPIKVVNMSFGGLCDDEDEYCTSNDYHPDDVYVRLSEALVLEGVVPVWAAGNGADLTDTRPPPNDGSESLTNNPGQSPLPGVLMVANYSDGNSGTRDNDLNSSSSRGRKGFPETYPDISAPGTEILAACRAWLPICSSGYGDTDYGAITGTSMAAPHVAGIVALLFQAEPDLTPALVEDILEDSAYQFGDADEYEDDIAVDGAIPGQIRNGNHQTHFARGHGLVDLTAALVEVAGITDPGLTIDNPCAAYSVVVDPEGDSAVLTGLGPEVGGGAPTPDVDIVSLTATAAEGPIDYTEVVYDEANPDGKNVAATDARYVRFTIGLADLPAAPNSRGDSVRSFFRADDVDFTLDMNRDLGPGGVELRSALSVPDPADATGIDNIVVARNMPMVFDAELDVAYIDLPVSVLGVDGGDTLVELRSLWRRSFVALAFPADEAAATCPLLIGGAPTANVPEGSPLLLLVGGAGVLLAGFWFSRRRQGFSPGGMAAVALVAVAGLSAVAATPAGAVVESRIKFDQRDNRVTYSVTVDSPNLEHSCVDTSGEVAVVNDTEDSACFQVPVTFDADDALSIQFLQVTATPTGEYGPGSDLDIYVIDEDTGEVLTTAAGIFAPTVGSPIEVAFRNVPTDGDFLVVVSSYQNFPGATYDLTVEGFAREPYID